ncbi:MAG: M23 family metallopeptidase [Anaerolineales bacterium]|nr:M23 family metallopeptidase [Anaerolineales bacterium]MCS7249190.1 M23 family metallopeptidase [Anaerolineales bacterium]MDW8163003.1 M23 family metallopeptidase [Anaerolineales bacterium]MDW8447507.1 M23 family metallopeptidase [Anaerolineales bacterium]
MKILYPFSKEYPITQTYQQHVERARRNNWCWMPGPCPSGVYYFGGIDYGCPEGTEIIGTAGVAEVVATQQGGYGMHVRVRHSDSFLTIYAHLSRFYVAQGEKIKDGQVIALSGNTGNSTGPHLHLETRNPNGIPVDPAELLLPLSETLKYVSPSPQPKFAVGDRVTLGRRFTYVNVRSSPSLSGNIITTLLPGDVVEVKKLSGEWVCVFSIRNLELWVHSAYLEQA